MFSSPEQSIRFRHYLSARPVAPSWLKSAPNATVQYVHGSASPSVRRFEEPRDENAPTPLAWLLRRISPYHYLPEVPVLKLQINGRPNSKRLALTIQRHRILDAAQPESFRFPWSRVNLKELMSLRVGGGNFSCQSALGASYILILIRSSNGMDLSCEESQFVTMTP